MLKIGPYEIATPYILAPMAGVSEMPFRRIAMKMGAGLAPTELVSAKGLFYESVRTTSYLTHDEKVETPFSVQLFGGEPESMAFAAEKAMMMGAHIIDINMGCPVKKVTKINAGSALLCDYARASAIVEAMLKRTNYKIPITAKIRSGWDHDSINCIEVARALEGAGISALAIHPRTRAQGYSGQANWEHIAQLKAHLSIPVIGNGDVVSIALAKKMQKKTGCDAVMIGRAALGNPWIFRDLVQGVPTPVSPEERYALVREHLTDHVEFCRRIAENEARLDRPFNEMKALERFRSHLIWYSKGLNHSAKFRTAVMSTQCVQKTKELIHQFFTTAHLSTDTCTDDGIDYRQAFG